MQSVLSVQPMVQVCVDGEQNWPIAQKSLSGRHSTQLPVLVSQTAFFGSAAQSALPLQPEAPPPPPVLEPPALPVLPAVPVPPAVPLVEVLLPPPWAELVVPLDPPVPPPPQAAPIAPSAASAIAGRTSADDVGRACDRVFMRRFSG
jgi:hypothetical protein